MFTCKKSHICDEMHDIFNLLESSECEMDEIKQRFKHFTGKLGYFDELPTNLRDLYISFINYKNEKALMEYGHRDFALSFQNYFMINFKIGNVIFIECTSLAQGKQNAKLADKNSMLYTLTR